MGDSMRSYRKCIKDPTLYWSSSTPNSCGFNRMGMGYVLELPRRHEINE